MLNQTLITVERQVRRLMRDLMVAAVNLRGAQRLWGLSSTSAGCEEDEEFTKLIRGWRSIVRAVWDESVHSAAICIDATCGRGGDLITLAAHADRGGLMHGVDTVNVCWIISSRLPWTKRRSV